MNRLDQIHPIGNKLTVSDKDSQQNGKLVRDANHKVGIPVVRFGSIQIRSYERIVGDHPEVSTGVPLSLAWQYKETEEVDLLAYEKQKEELLTMTEGKPWLQGVRRLSSGTRRDMLRIEFEIPLQEIEQAEAQVELVKKQRAQTNKQKKFFARTEEIMQAASRKMKRSFSRDSPNYQSFPKRREVSVAPPPINFPSTPPPKPLRMREVSV